MNAAQHQGIYKQCPGTYLQKVFLVIITVYSNLGQQQLKRQLMLKPKSLNVQEAHFQIFYVGLKIFFPSLLSEQSALQNFVFHIQFHKDRILKEILDP